MGNALLRKMSLDALSQVNTARRLALLKKGKHARKAAALYHGLYTHLAQNHRKLEGGSPHHQNETADEFGPW
ncbi:hypothetical protein CapIbe_007286 [Capra ibex]